MTSAPASVQARVNYVDRPLNWAQITQCADSETLKLIQKVNEGQLDSTRYSVRTMFYTIGNTPVEQESRLLCYIPKGHRLSFLRVFNDEHQTRRMISY